MSFRLAHDADPLPHLPVEHGRAGDGVGNWVPEMKHTFLAKYVEGTRRAREKFKQWFFKVVMPNIRNGIMAAFIIGFITSFNQVPVSLFLTGPGVSTLPIDMMAYMEFNYDPSIAALSGLLAFMSLLIVMVAEKLLGLSRYV